MNAETIKSKFLFVTVESWLDFFSSLVITLLYPLPLLDDKEDITSQLLSSLSKQKRLQIKAFTNENKYARVHLTICRAGFQVSIQEWQDLLVAGLQRLLGNVGGPVLERVQGCVGQRNVAQTQPQSRLNPTKTQTHTFTSTTESKTL